MAVLNINLAVAVSSHCTFIKRVGLTCGLVRMDICLQSMCELTFNKGSYFDCDDVINGLMEQYLPIYLGLPYQRIY